MTHKVLFAPEARDDIKALYLFIAERAGDSRALSYIERSVSIAFLVGTNSVTFLRILYGGRDLDFLMSP